MPLSTSDLLQIALITFFTTLIGRWANRIIDNLEKKAQQAKQTIKERIRP
jgi:hypothetical protein